MSNLGKVTVYQWSPEQVTDHLRKIGADKPPEKPKKGFGTLASQQKQGSNHYNRSGGEW
ncbi:hypothetical protein [Paenibacillus rhizophilus]|uniref:hypothetical protein n=1 Tax=Paenibacillus rhizophilus TaxID=1850366 RepID=UPI00163A867A|nr:hypothetical protein [Paenibacillus rhizophilus]